MAEKNYVITIARGFGSGGREIGMLLGKTLGIPCYGRQILKMASEFSGINEALFSNADEKLSNADYIKSVLHAMPKLSHMAEPTQKDFVSDVNLFNIQAHIIRKLAESESCVIIGKCANNILRGYDNVLSIYVEAPRDYCVKTVMDRLNVTEDEANRMIYRTDKYRSDYYKYYSGGENWRNPTCYDVTINTERLDHEQCVEMIKSLIRIKLGIEV
ncbi:MAG: AAA family ATPase [Huintestinicola sp.]